MNERDQGRAPADGGPRRVVVTGAESTGKTRLAEQVARHYGVPWVPEYARDYALRQARPLLEFDVEPIARGQLAAETQGLLMPVPLLVLDTDLLSTAVYARHYYGWCPDWLAHASRGRSGLYLLLDIDLPFLPDPTRGPAERRQELHELFREALSDAGADWVLVGGEGKARMEAAVGAIDAWTARQGKVSG